MDEAFKEFDMHPNGDDDDDDDDHFGRILLHVAMEQNNFNLVEVLLSVGLNPNAKEHCGAMPLTLSLIDRNVKLTQILVDANASCSCPLLAEVPSPMDMALKLQYATTICYYLTL